MYHLPPSEDIHIAGINRWDDKSMLWANSVRHVMSLLWRDTYDMGRVC